MKAILIVIGAIVAVSGIVMALYSMFKKYFKVTFECGNVCDDDCFDDENEDYEPLCFCEDDNSEEE